MTMPVPVVSQAALEMWGAMPSRYLDEDENYGYPLLYFCESICRYIQSINDVARDLPDGTPGWAIIMDPNRAPARYLPWLGQFVGVVVDTTTPDSAQRAAILAEAGFNRGSVSYMVNAIKAHLTGNKTVTLQERDTSAYHFTLTVYTAEISGGSFDAIDARFQTYDELDAAFPTYADMLASTDEVSKALVATKPAGLIANLVFAAGSPP